MGKSSNLLQSAKQTKQVAQIETSTPDVAVLIDLYKVSPGQQVPEKTYLVDCFSVPFLAVGELSLIRGKQKSGKTAVVRDFIRAIYCDDPIARPRQTEKLKVGYFDCEMSIRDTLKVFEGIPAEKLTYIHAFNLRGEPNQLQTIKAITEYLNLDIVVIDTIGDVVTDMNDPERATIAVGEFLRWIEQTQVSIIATTHTNKNDNNAQGHWGYQLQKKCHDSLLVDMVGDYEYQLITHTDAREQHIPAFKCVIYNGLRTYQPADENDKKRNRK